MDKHVPNRKIKKAVLITITAMVILAVAVFVILYMQNRLPEHIEWQEKMLDTRDGILIRIQH